MFSLDLDSIYGSDFIDCFFSDFDFLNRDKYLCFSSFLNYGKLLNVMYFLCDFSDSFFLPCFFNYFYEFVCEYINCIVFLLFSLFDCNSYIEISFILSRINVLHISFFNISCEFFNYF